jgi:hypothetical protein
MQNDKKPTSIYTHANGQTNDVICVSIMENVLGACAKITSHFYAQMHPARLRFETLTYLDMLKAFAPCRTGTSAPKNANPIVA